MRKELFYILILFSIFINADQKLMGTKGIIDIGNKEVSTEIEVPAQYIQSDPITKIIPNEIVYKEREQSELFDCEIDFLGTKTCPIATADCPSFEEFTLGYSEKHTTIKYFEKLCANNEIKIGDRCYSDLNKDGIIDRIKFDNKINPCPDGSVIDSNSTQTGIKNENRFFWLQRDKRKSSTATIVYTGNKAVTPPSYPNINHPDVVNYARNQRTDGSLWGGNEHKYMRWFYGQYTNGKIPYHYGNSNGWTLLRADNVPTTFNFDTTCYSITKCPANTILQSDGRCQMKYDWYSYHCPIDTNDYTNSWITRNPGNDCGNPTCTNVSNPPSNNCVRVNYTCPLDPNQMCGKTVNNEINCGKGYIFKDYRCVREEPYCGEYTYNAAKDICEDIKISNKQCLNSNEIFDLGLNKCVSKTPVCLYGKWNSTLSMCETDYEALCEQEGYTFNKESGLCENKELPVCDDQYFYSSELLACVGEMTFCAPDEIYNEETSMCEKKVCGTNNTVEADGRCETTSLCDGILTENGTCIPNTVVK